MKRGGIKGGEFDLGGLVPWCLGVATSVYYSICLLVILCGCSSNVELTGGSAGEVGNTISGVIIDEDGKTVSGVEVLLLSPDYNAYEERKLTKRAVSLKAFTDEEGAYAFDSVAAGTYNLEASSADNSIMLLMRGVEAVDDDDTENPYGILRKPGVMRIDLTEYTAWL
jgi:hypothetical protein